MTQALLILDLDETLMHAREIPLEWTEDFRIGPYFAYRRPFLENFLERVSKSFRLAVWTSSSPEYALGAV